MNYMENVAKMLGVELEEEFNIKFSNGSVSDSTYKITIEGLKNSSDNYNRYLPYCLMDLLTGEDVIVKQSSWKLKDGETYYSFALIKGELTITSFEWYGTFSNWLRYHNGFCYKTREEAEADKTRAEKFLQSNDIINCES